MILFDPDQPEAASGFAELTAVSALPTRQTLLKHLRASQAAVGLKGEVSVLLTTDEGIRGLNRRFRKKNKATDVLSFPAEPGFGLAGDLAISVDTAARQAEEQGHRLAVELRVLMLHGLLHLAGMDHETDDGAMARREARLRAKLKLPLGLIERVEGEAVAGWGKKQIPLRGMIERKARTTARTTAKTTARTTAKTTARTTARTTAKTIAKADSPKGNGRKKSTSGNGSANKSAGAARVGIARSGAAR